MSQRKTYTQAFKLEAIRLLESSDQPISELALELGVRRNQLYKWQQQYKDQGNAAFKDKLGRPKKGAMSETVRLRQEVAELREENEILKKAAAYFAKDMK